MFFQFHEAICTSYCLLPLFPSPFLLYVYTCPHANCVYIHTYIYMYVHVYCIHVHVHVHVYCIHVQYMLYIHTMYLPSMVLYERVGVTLLVYIHEVV